MPQFAPGKQALSVEETPGRCATEQDRPSNNQRRFDDSSCQARPKAIAQSMTTVKRAIIVEILSMQGECGKGGAVLFEADATRCIAREPKQA